MTPASSSNQDDVERARAIADAQHKRAQEMVEPLKQAARRAGERRAEHLRDAIELLDRIYGRNAPHQLSDSGMAEEWIDTEIIQFIRKYGSFSDQLANTAAHVPDPNQRFADRLRIEGDGTYRNTRVLFDGEQLHGVQEVTWAILGHKPVSVTITFVGRPEIDVKP